MPWVGIQYTMSMGFDIDCFDDVRILTFVQNYQMLSPSSSSEAFLEAS